MQLCSKMSKMHSFCVISSCKAIQHLNTRFLMHQWYGQPNSFILTCVFIDMI